MKIKKRFAKSLRSLAKRLDPDGEPKGSLYVFDSSKINSLMEAAKVRLTDPEAPLLDRVSSAQFLMSPVIDPKDITKIRGV